MNRVSIDVSFELSLVTIDAWSAPPPGEHERHYVGFAQGPAAKDFLKTLSRKINSAYPGTGILLNVSGGTIPEDQ